MLMQRQKTGLPVNSKKLAPKMMTMSSKELELMLKPFKVQSPKAIVAPNKQIKIKQSKTTVNAEPAG